jgi:hypothetical protein
MRLNRTALLYKLLPYIHNILSNLKRVFAIHEVTIGRMKGQGIIRT